MEEATADYFIKQQLSNDFGLPTPDYSLYDALVRITDNNSRSPVSTQSTDGISLMGDGVSTPIRAMLTEEAIAAADGTMSVTYNSNGTVALRALVSQPLFSSPDLSITIDPPTVEGGGYEMSLGTGFTGSSSLSVVNDGAMPPTYSFSIPTSAIVGAAPAPGITPVTVDTTGGIFALSIPFAVEGSIPRTVIVGGDIGTTPSAATLEEAITLINAAGDPPTLALPWQILIAPGQYGVAATTAQIPSNVYIAALESSTVTLLQNLSWTDATAVENRIGISGITLSGSLTIDTSTKTGALSTAYIDRATLNGAYTYNARNSSNSLSSARNDSVIINNCIIAGTITLTGGLTELKNSDVLSGATTNVNASSASLGTKLQARDSRIHTLSLINRSYTTLTGCHMRGTWQNDGSTAFFAINSCVPAPASNWVFRSNNLSTAYMKNTPHNVLVTRNGDPGGAYTITSLQISTSTPGTSGTVDRDIDVTLLSMTPGVTAEVTINIPLTTAPYAVAGTGTQPSVSTFQVTAGLAGIHPGYSTSTAGLLMINNGAAGVTSAGLSIRVPLPSTIMWF